MKVCSVCGKSRSERFFLGARGKICDRCRKKKRSESAHAGRVRKTYGLEEGDYDALMRAQGGVCAICLQPRSARLAVDHRHSDGLVRGLLCRRCNGALLARGARDSADILERAAAYLRQPPAVGVIGERYAPE